MFKVYSFFVVFIFSNFFIQSPMAVEGGLEYTDKPQKLTRNQKDLLKKMEKDFQGANFPFSFSDPNFPAEPFTCLTFRGKRVEQKKKAISFFIRSAIKEVIQLCNGVVSYKPNERDKVIDAFSLCAQLSSAFKFPCENVFSYTADYLKLDKKVPSNLGYVRYDGKGEYKKKVEECLENGQLNGDHFQSDKQEIMLLFAVFLGDAKDYSAAIAPIEVLKRNGKLSIAQYFSNQISMAQSMIDFCVL